MPWPLYLRGFPGADPLDGLSLRSRLLLHMAVTCVLTVALLVLITPVLHWVEFAPGVQLLEVVTFTLVLAPLMLAVRRTSSLLLYLFILVQLAGLDLYLDDHYRRHGLPALWSYVPGTWVANLSPHALQAFLTQSVDAVLGGPVALWVSRLLAKAFGPKTPAAAEPIFPSTWTAEVVPRPPRDFFGFWFLRILGLIYIGYISILLLGGLGTSPWPTSVAQLFELTYANPYLCMNTAGKACIMGALALIGAYNRPLRFAATTALLVGHAMSVASCLGFYFYDAPEAPFHGFLLTSALIDSGVVVLLLITLFKAHAYALPKSAAELPSAFSLPTLLWRVALLGGALYALGVVVFSLLGRLEILRLPVWSDLFVGSDPSLGNSLAMHSALTVLCVWMAFRARLRTAFVSALQLSLGAAVGLGFLLLCTGRVTVNTGRPINLQTLLLLHELVFVFFLVGLASLGALWMNVEYSVTSFSAPGAQALLALHDAAFPQAERSDILQAIDRYAGTIRGRKRGLLNFPFWLIERIFPALYSAHPAFSALSPDEARYFLRSYLIRPEAERQRSLCPELAELAFQLGVAAQSIIFFGAYTGLVQHQQIGYVPPDARERLQTGLTPATPPGAQVAKLPVDEKDPLNWPPVSNAPPRRVPAPRVSTPVREPPIPNEVDYLIIGSGPGGAVAAYRLACRYPKARIAVLEAGPRLSPREDFNGREMEMIAKLYKEGGIQQTKRADMIVLQGQCVGGGGVVYNAVCYTMPPPVRAAWASEYGLSLSGLDAAYAKVAEELGIQPIGQGGVNQRVAGVFQKAVAGVNAASPEPLLESPSLVQINGQSCMGDGLWNIGDKHFGKRTVLETYLPWAEARGVEIIPNCTAVTFEHENGRASCVLAHSVGGDLARIRVKESLVVAGGVLASSQLLLQSGLALPAGQRLSCNFALPAIYDFDQELDAFDGEQITLGAKDLRGRAIFETYFNPPGALALMTPFFFERHRGVMTRYKNLVAFGALVGSEPNGTLNAAPDLLNGAGFDWTLGRQDQEHLAFGLETLYRLGEAAGAKRVVLPTRPGVELSYGKDSLADFSKALRTRPLRVEDLLLNTAHPQGGNLMAAAGSPGERLRVVDESFRVVGLRNVYVVDASVFPTSLTVNPQWTILALSSVASANI
jgi:choline dehydrogenase-like flavoprotein